MEGRMRPYLPELTIRDYNTYLWYLRGVRWQMSRSYGFYSCRLLQHNGVLFALLADSLAGLRQPAPAGYALLQADDVPDPGHPPGGTGGSDDGLA